MPYYGKLFYRVREARAGARAEVTTFLHNRSAALAYARRAAALGGFVVTLEGTDDRFPANVITREVIQ